MSRSVRLEQNPASFRWLAYKTARRLQTWARCIPPLLITLLARQICLTKYSTATRELKHDTCDGDRSRTPDQCESESYLLVSLTGMIDDRLYVG